jgi:hypothetical protein
LLTDSEQNFNHNGSHGSKALADVFIPGANSEELQSLAKFQRLSSRPETGQEGPGDFGI